MLVGGSDLDHLAATEYDSILQWNIRQQQIDWRSSFLVVDLAEAFGEGFFFFILTNGLVILEKG